MLGKITRNTQAVASLSGITGDKKIFDSVYERLELGPGEFGGIHGGYIIRCVMFSAGPA
jgi:hypothetical protein